MPAQLNLAEVLAVLVAFSPIVYKATDFLKLVLARDLNAWLTQLVVWVVGVLVAFLVVNSNYGDNATIHTLNWAATILAGLSLGSVGSTIYDFKAARDNTDSAAKPPLLRKHARVVTPKTKKPVV